MILFVNHRDNTLYTLPPNSCIFFHIHKLCKYISDDHIEKRFTILDPIDFNKKPGRNPQRQNIYFDLPYQIAFQIEKLFPHKSSIFY